MLTLWSLYKDNATAVGVFCVVLGFMGGFAKFAVLDPVHQRFDAIDQRINDPRADMTGRFDAQDQRLDSLKADVTRGFEQLDNEMSELRKLGERVSRNEANIDTIRGQLRTADPPGP